MMLIAALLAASSPDAVNHKVVVDGHSYRVKVIGRTVKVFDKSWLVAATPEQGEKLRAAVKAATGCEIEHAFWAASHLEGILKCGTVEKSE